MNLVDKLDRLYSSLHLRTRRQSLMRYVIRTVSNAIIPSYFRLFPAQTKPKQQSLDREVIVSLTSFPARINKLWLVIECLLRQSFLPSSIVLWLSKEQFPKEISDLPMSLKKYVDRNLLQVFFVEEDLRSHKKYYYAFKKFPNSIIITVDDDLFYSSNSLKYLIDLYRENPNTICCLRAFEVEKDNGRLKPYRDWIKVKKAYGPTLKLFHTSGGGTLYTKEMFPAEVLNKEAFTSLCFYADDVWLNFMAQLNRTKTVKSSFYSHLIPIKSNSLKLSTQNVQDGGNDKQIRALLDHYKIDENEIFI